MRFNQFCATAALAATLFIGQRNAGAADADPYEQYVKTSKDFQPVRQEPAMLLKAFPSWTYMPWTYQWTIGYNDASGKWSVENGYNGAFVDWDRIDAEGSKTGRLDWIDKFKLRFYVDHLGGKRLLHMWDGSPPKNQLNALHGNGVRSVPVNAAMIAKLHEYISRHIAAVKSSPNRGAYALDDEISWGHFVHPAMWCVTDDKAAYPAWLKEIYGADAPQRDKWVTYNDIEPKLPTWTIADFDASPLMDQWTFNDSYWNNFLGDLVEYANSIDPATPCGFVGGQNPSPFGGYDYAKIMRKVQYIEAYNMGSSQAIIRSFNPHNAIPQVTSHFHRSSDDDIWQVWYYLAHGNRGMIGWVEKWFDGTQPKPWHQEVAPTYLEADNKIGPLMSGAQWQHDGVAIYYSQASIQLGWILMPRLMGKPGPTATATIVLAHRIMSAMPGENMLRDEGIEYNFLSYADVIQQGVPKQYRVLILPACFCLSDVEARQIKAFVADGGTVLADYMPGLWDQHGKGRSAGGAIDELLGVKHSPQLSAKDVFGGRLWCEVDQDANFGWKTYDSFLSNKNTCIKDASGFDKAVREMPVNHVNKIGKGSAVLLNLSPQWYNAYRTAGPESAAKRAIFMNPIHAAGIARRVTIDGGEKTQSAEITYWTKGSRTILFVVSNPEISVSSTGGGNSVGLKSDTVPITLTFAEPIKGARDERTGKDLPAGKSFKFDWKMNEAVVISYESAGK